MICQHVLFFLVTKQEEGLYRDFFLNYLRGEEKLKFRKLLLLDRCFIDNCISFRPLYHQNSYHLLVSFLHAVPSCTLGSTLLGKYVVSALPMWKVQGGYLPCHVTTTSELKSQDLSQLCMMSQPFLFLLKSRLETNYTRQLPVISRIYQTNQEIRFHPHFPPCQPAQIFICALAGFQSTMSWARFVAQLASTDHAFWCHQASAHHQHEFIMCFVGNKLMKVGNHWKSFTFSCVIQSSHYSHIIALGNIIKDLLMLAL